MAGESRRCEGGGVVSRCTPNRQLSALLLEADWSAADLARAVNALGTAQGLALRYDRTSVAHWLTGSRPRAPVPDLAAQALSRRSGRPVTARETGLTQFPRAAAVRSGLAEEGEPLRRLGALCRGESDPAQRAELARTVYTVTTAPSARPGPAPPPARVAARRRAVHPSDVQGLTEMSGVFASLAQTHGGGHARTALAAYLGDDVVPLLDASGSESWHRELLTGCAQLTHVLAAMTDDAGHHGLARRYFRTTLSLAREAGSRAVRAITLRVMSGQALRLGYLHHAAELAQAAVGVDAAGLDVQAFVLVQRALVRATQRRAREALADLGAAEGAHERASGAPGPFTAYPRSGLDYQRALTFRALGRTDDALAALHDSVRHRSGGEQRGDALTQARIAEMLLEQGRLEEACARWHAFLDVYPRLHSVQADQALGRLTRTLRSFVRHPHAAGVQERARGVSRPTRLTHPARPTRPTRPARTA